jgi:hypothetical protein
MTYLSNPNATSASTRAANDHALTQGRRAAVLLIGQFIAMWAAFFILAPSINWPASLDEPPGVVLPLILEQSLAVFLGYFSYLVHALFLIPIAAIIPAALKMGGVMERNALAFGVLAGFAKALGISRWLFLMPSLAISFVDPATSEGSKAAIAAIYVAFNAYAGGMGEVLGVGLFAGIWTILISSALIRSGARILGSAGVGAAILLFSTLPSVIGIESPVLLTLSGVLWQLWTVALAVFLWRRR